MYLGQEARLETHLLPGLLRTMSLLPLPQAALEVELVRRVEDNPALERRSAAFCGGCGYPGASRCARCASVPAAVEPSGTPWDDIEVTAGCEIRSGARAALPVVLDHLTALGLLDADPDEIAAVHRLPVADVREAIRAVVAAGPVGVASRSVPELLARQAERAVTAGVAPGWLVPLVRDHLSWVAERDVAAVTSAFAVTEEEAAAVFELVRRQLRPDADVRRGTAPELAVAAPDVYVDRGRDGLVVRVPGSMDLGLVVVEAGPELRSHPEARAWLERHEGAARELLRRLDVRADALGRVATEVVRRQHRYFDVGHAGLVDLSRAQVATALGLHASTVSRAIAGKTLRHPDGRVVPLAELLGTGAAIRTRLRELAAAGPISDSSLAGLLAAEGFVVARRTVAKYRAQLGLRGLGRPGS
jgi:RNA polymerase sigma-54 factor